MKLQHLAIIFVIIILPISMVISSYIQTQIDTINLQSTYNTKLQNATYDAMLAFRLNTTNNKYSSVSDSKIRDIEASVSTFYDSLVVGEGYTKEEMQDFVPAIVYTMYDGYYIYGRYYNDMDKEYQYGLKPYIYYSCRYKKGDNLDVVVNYTLDNYITVYGTIKGQYVAVGGYILNPYKVSDVKKDANGNIISLKYADTEITSEILQEQLIILNDSNNATDATMYDYTTIDNNKIYYDGQDYFMYNNYKKQKVRDEETLNQLISMTKNGHLYDNSAVMYYYEGYRFSYWAETYLGSITQEDAVDEQGNKITDFAVNTGNKKIFNYKGINSTEYTTFNENRMSVIRRSIESNLKTAIAAYNENFRNTYYFTLPVINEEEWEKILNNISIISFMQGIPIGTKYFNDYCVMTNNQNKEVVTPDTLYAITEDGDVHRLGCKDIVDNKKKVVAIYKNTDFERQTVTITENNEVFFYPHANSRCYNCLVNQGTTYSVSDIVNLRVKSYNETSGDYKEINANKATLETLRVQILTAIARESYTLYKMNDYFKNPEAMTEIDEITGDVVNLRVTRVEWHQDANGMGINNATAYLKKASTVSDTLKAQYQVNPTQDSINDESKWITGMEIPNLKHGDKVYIRLFNETYSGDYSTMTILDSIPPEMPRIVVVNNATEFNNFYNKPVQIKIEQGIDKQTGTEKTTYKLEGVQSTNGQEVNYTLGDIITISEEGTTVLTAYSYDKVGNRTAAIFIVNKDESKPGDPTLKVVQGTEGQNGWYISDTVKVEITEGQDYGPSGILNMTYKMEGATNVAEEAAADGTIFELTNEGTTTITAYMHDKAGNNSDGSSLTIKKDSQLPTIIQNIADSNVSTTKSLGVNFKVADTNSGLQKIEWSYQKTGTTTINKVTDNYSGQTTQIPVNKVFGELVSGTYTISAKIYDMAGNNTSIGPIEVSTKPMLKATGATVSNGNWTNQDVTVTLPDKTSEGLTTQYSINNGSWKSDTKVITVEENNTVIAYRYTDGVNTQDGYATININNIDKGYPEITRGIERTGITGTSFTLSIKVKDSLSGLGQIIWYYKKSDDSSWQSVTDTYTTLNGSTAGKTSEQEKSHKFSGITSGALYDVYAVIYDVAGNQVTAPQVSIQTDNSADKPATISISGSTKETSLPVTLNANVTVDDSLSGVNIGACKWHIDNNSSIGIDPSSYTNDLGSNGIQISFDISSSGTWYLHILTIDNAGNAREDVKQIKVITNYHEHNNSCYETHTHNNSCNCGGQMYTPYGTHYVHNCRECGNSTAAWYLASEEAVPGADCNKNHHGGGKCNKKICEKEENQQYLICDKSTNTIDDYSISWE